MVIGYVETVRILAAWCELRHDFRHFRADRIVAAEFLEARYPARPMELRAPLARASRGSVGGEKLGDVSSRPGGSSFSGPS